MYLITDIVLTAQWIYYRLKTRIKQRKLKKMNTSMTEKSSLLSQKSMTSIYHTPNNSNQVRFNASDDHHQNDHGSGGDNAIKESAVFSEPESDLAAYDTQEEQEDYPSPSAKQQHGTSAMGRTLTSPTGFLPPTILLGNNKQQQQHASSWTVVNPNSPASMPHTHETKFLHEGSFDNQPSLNLSKTNTSVMMGTSNNNSSSNTLGKNNGKKGTLFALLFFVGMFVFMVPVMPRMMRQSSAPPSSFRIARKLLKNDEDQNPFSSVTDGIGFIMQCMSALIYIISRVPQIVLNVCISIATITQNKNSGVVRVSQV